MAPLISVVIPTYNRARDLSRALKSLLAQTYIHWEAVVVDNQSDDDTDAVVNSFNDSRIKLAKIQNNGVIAASRNVGINLARGQYVAFLDSDDWWKPQKLEVSLKHLQYGADVVYHDLYSVSRVDQIFFLKKAKTFKLQKPVFNSLISNGNALINSSVVVRKDILLAINGLSEDLDLISAEDYDAWLKIAKITDSFFRINKTLGYYWAGGGNVSNPQRTLKACDAIEVRYLNKENLTEPGIALGWLDYARGRAHYSLRHYESAERFLKPIKLNRSNFQIAIKARWTLLMIAFCRLRDF
jgi:glycosyltransferase involved in cell wall biosynthesis